jgi:hypothetical protein
MVGVTAGCSASAGCADPTAACYGDGGPVGYCGPNNCAAGAAPFEACSAQGSGDGVCLPFDIDGGSAELCNQAGALPVGATGCLTARGAGGAGFCAQTGYCFGYYTPTCLALCANLGGSCGAGSDCVGFGDDFGVCATDCTGAPSSCPAGQTCYPLTTGQSACLP